MIELAMASRDAYGRIVWPDGRALLDQPVKLIAAFNVAFDACERWKKKPGAA